MTLLCWSASGGRDCTVTTDCNDTVGDQCFLSGMKRRIADTTHEPYRVCYYATWARYRPANAALLPSQVDPFLCTHIIMAFASISSEGRLELLSPEDESAITGLLQHKIKNPNLKVWKSRTMELFYPLKTMFNFRFSQQSAVGILVLNHSAIL